MIRLYLKKTVLLGFISLLSLFSFSQAGESYYQGAAVTSNTVRVKFTNEPEIVSTMENAYALNLNNQTVNTSSVKTYYEVSGLAELNSLNETYSVTQMKRAFRDAGKHEYKHREFGLHLWYEIEYSDAADITEVISAYSKLEYIQVAEPQYIAESHGTLLETTDDPLYSTQWHYENDGSTGGTVDADIDLEEAWTVETGNSNVIVSVHDYGIDVNHPDLIGNVWINAGEIAGNGIDDDNNGYIDDVNGYNFADDVGAVTGGDHGTHVAGTIGAETNNGIGVSGIAGGSGHDDGVRLMSCQLYSDNTSSGFGEAFTYAADNGSVISQNSWGYIAGYFPDYVKEAIDYYIANAGSPDEAMDGGLAIFSAGNSGVNSDFYPGYYESVIAVGATDHDDKLTSYSNYGDWVDICAPGGYDIYPQGIYSTLPNESYGYSRGTSMACPHVTGVAALIVSHNYGTLTPDQVRYRLESHADNIDVQNPDYIGWVGAGRLNAYGSVYHNIYSPLPYSMDFENGSVDDYWDLKTENEYGRLIVSSDNSPNGNYHLTSDVSENGYYSTNEAWLKLDLTYEFDVNLSFNWKEFKDEADIEDGVFFSDDGGENFTYVYSLHNGTSEYEQIVLDVDELAKKYDVELSENFVIKFQHKDNYSLPTDGFAYDDISVYAVLPDTFQLQLEIAFDEYPEETSWEIIDSLGRIPYSGDDYKDYSNSLNLIVGLYLPEGCYTLNVYDSYGDGMCCSDGEGSYTLSQDTEILSTGSSFSYIETTEFCVVATLNTTLVNANNGVTEALAINDVKEIVAVKIYPNLASNYFIIETESGVETLSNYMIHDMSGKILRSGKLTGNQTQVEIVDFSAGLYIVKVAIDSDIQTFKLIKY